MSHAACRSGTQGMRSSGRWCSARFCCRWSWTKLAWPTGVPKTTRPRRSGGSVRAPTQMSANPDVSRWCRPALLQPRSRPASSQGAPLCPHHNTSNAGHRVHTLRLAHGVQLSSKRTRSPRGARWPPAAPGAAPARVGRVSLLAPFCLANAVRHGVVTREAPQHWTWS